MKKKLSRAEKFVKDALKLLREINRSRELAEMERQHRRNVYQNRSGKAPAYAREMFPEIRDELFEEEIP